MNDINNRSTLICGACDHWEIEKQFPSSYFERDRTLMAPCRLNMQNGKRQKYDGNCAYNTSDPNRSELVRITVGKNMRISPFRLFIEDAYVLGLEDQKKREDAKNCNNCANWDNHDKCPCYGMVGDLNDYLRCNKWEVVMANIEGCNDV